MCTAVTVQRGLLIVDFSREVKDGRHTTYFVETLCLVAPPNTKKNARGSGNSRAIDGSLFWVGGQQVEKEENYEEHGLTQA